MKEVDYERARARVMGLDRILERPWLLVSTEYEFFHNMPHIADQAAIVLSHARQARPLAESHRNFNVGAAAMVRREGNAIAFGHGVNIKSGPGRSTIDVHAEESILKALRPEDEVTSIAIVGPLQEDHGSGRSSSTLHPCTYRCQPLLAESPQVTEETLIFCSTPDALQVEWGTLHDFQSFHRTNDSSVIHSASFESLPSVFLPLPEVEVYGPEHHVDTSEWDSKVKSPILEWAHERRFS